MSDACSTDHRRGKKWPTVGTFSTGKKQVGSGLKPQKHNLIFDEKEIKFKI
jgi:hypothetical protein